MNEHIDIALLSETWFKPKVPVKFGGYNVIRKDRADGKSGCAILIKREIPFKEVNVYKIRDIMIVCVEISLINNTKCSVISLYNSPSNNIPYREWDKLFKSVSGDVILAGDFNVHCEVFGSSFTNSKGRQLLDAVQDNNYVYLNDGSPTIIGSGIKQRNKSAVDLTFCTPQIASKFRWNVHKDDLGSDHYPIVIESTSSLLENRIIRPYCKWNTSKANWEVFGRSFDSEKVSTLNYNQLVGYINEASKVSIPERKEIKSKYAKCWWTEECATNVKKRKEALKNYLQHPSEANFIAYKRQVAFTKMIINKSKRDSWRTFCKNLNKTVPIKRIWAKIQSIGNQIAYSPLVKENWVYEFLHKLTPDSVENKLEAECTSVDDNHFLMESFSFKEFSLAIKARSNTAPGVDQIQYNQIANLPVSAKTRLLHLYNEMWRSGEFPSQWKDFVVCPILKPNKCKEDSQSYRPIALASCLLKTFERLIKRRLEWWLEVNNKFPATQYGFRKSRSVYDCQVQLITDIMQAFTSNNVVLALFLDFTAAYDSVQMPILSVKLRNLGLPEKFISNIISLISQRKIHIRINDELIGPRFTSIGLPQGGILSPILYTLYTADLESIFSLSPEIKILQYADDVCIYVTKPNLLECTVVLEDVIKKLDKWVAETGLEISEKKSVVCPFSRHRRLQISDSINLAGRNFPCERSVKFLGLTLDKVLNWKPHVTMVEKKAEKYFNTLRSVSHHKWGADPDVSLMFYRGTIRSVLDFGGMFYGSAKKSILRPLQIIQNKCMRLCLGFLRSTPLDVMYAEACELPLQYRLRVLSHRYVLKMSVCDNNIYNKICQLNTKVLTNRYWVKRPAPVFCDSFIEVSKLNKLVFKKPIHSLQEYQVYLTNIHVSNIGDLSQYPLKIRNSIFQDTIETFWPGAYVLFTDGSNLNGNTGCAFYDPQKKFCKLVRLHEYSSVYTAEMVAIFLALEYITSYRDKKNYAIISDSKSALGKLSNLKIGEYDSLPIQILRMVAGLFEDGISVNFGWVKSHSGVKFNEIVDALAKEATVYGEKVDHIPISISDAKRLLGASELADWQHTYSANDKGRLYKLTNPQLKSHPWFKGLNVSKSLVSNISRLRSNHAVCRAYMYKIGQCPSPYCDKCKEVEDFRHIVMTCEKFTEKRRTLFKNVGHHLENPFNYESMLFCDKLDVLEELGSFLSAYSYVEK